MLPTYNVSFGLSASNPGQHAFLLPPNWAGGNNNLQVNIYGVAGPGMNPSTPAACALPAPGSGSQIIFSLAWTTVSGQTVAQVTVLGSAISADDKASRAALFTAFATFRLQLAALEQVNNNGQACLISGGAAIIANRVALSLPLRLSETLKFYYNFNADHRYVDLIPGMRLRIDPAAYSYTGPAYAGGGQANGYVTAGSYFLLIQLGANNMIVFDAWAGSIAPSSVIVNPNEQAAGSPSPILGLIDLSAQGMACSHWRLIWPSQFGGVPTGSGGPTISQNVAFIGANTLSDLDTATQGFINGGTTSTPNVTYAFFSGRAAVVPEIIVVSNNAPQWVPVGTTLRQMALQTGLPSLTDFNGPPGGSLPGAFQAQMMRWALSSVGTYVQYQVLFNVATAAQFGADGLTQWDIPLTFGDSVAFMQQP